MYLFLDGESEKETVTFVEWKRALVGNPRGTSNFPLYDKSNWIDCLDTWQIGAFKVLSQLTQWWRRMKESSSRTYHFEFFWFWLQARTWRRGELFPRFGNCNDTNHPDYFISTFFSQVRFPTSCPRASTLCRESHTHPGFGLFRFTSNVLLFFRHSLIYCHWATINEIIK